MTANTSGAARVRVQWSQLPVALHTAAAELLSSPVVVAESCSGGFSPGSADRVILADGRRAFIKTANERRGPTHRYHLQEANIVAALPPGLPIAYSLGVVSDDEWIAAIYDDVDGEPPATPWKNTDIHAVLDSLSVIAAKPMPAEVAELLPTAPSFWAKSSIDVDWDAITPGARAKLARTYPWLPEALSSNLADDALLLKDLAGDSLVHFDVRADNVLIRSNGTAVLVDWPWAVVGPDWFDPATLLFNVAYFDPSFDARPWLANHLSFSTTTPEQVARLWLAFAGFFLAAGTSPDPPGVPGLSRFRIDQGHACLRLVGQVWSTK